MAAGLHGGLQLVCWGGQTLIAYAFREQRVILLGREVLQCAMLSSKAPGLQGALECALGAAVLEAVRQVESG